MTGALLILFYLVLFNFCIYRFEKLRLKNLTRFVSLALFNIKFITGIFIWFIYTIYYKDIQNNDIHKFYKDAQVLRDVARQSPVDFVQIVSGINSNDEKFEKYYANMKNWRRNFDEAPFNENQTIIRINAVLMFFSFETYFVHMLFMCFLSFIGWVLIANAILSFTDVKNSILAIPIMILPSVLFWTSGVMKEPVLVFGLGLFVYGLLHFPTLKSFVFLASGAIVIILIKFYVLVCLLPAAFAYLLLKRRTTPVFVTAKYSVVNIVLLALAFSLNQIYPSKDLKQMLVNKQTNSVREAEYFNAGSRIEPPTITTNTSSILAAAPAGIWNTVFRPYLWEGKNVMMLASALENIVVIALIALCLFLTDWKNFRHSNLILFLLNFSLAYFAIIGICTPVLGNLVRYKAPLLPIFLFVFIININPKRLPNFKFIMG